MNVLFISPHFPRHFYQFCERLKSRGVTVLGIGDCSWEGLGDNCRNALTDYRAVSSLMDYEAVYRIVAEYIYRYGRIDYVSSQNEFWLELEAQIRTDFHIMTGPHVEELATMNRKSLMKARYEKAGVKAARWTLPATLDDALSFASKVGYPVIVKPDKGVGAASTYKIHDAGELADFWSTKPDSVIFIEEECVPGHVETFDGITNSRGEVLFAASQCLPVSLMDAVNGDTDVVSYCQAPSEDLRRAGEATLKQYPASHLFFHFEFFRLDEDKAGLGKKGDIVGLEVNMRSPGGRIPDKMNYAYDTDVYTIWADSLIHDKCFMNSEFKHYITHIGRKNSIAYAFDLDEIRRRWGHCMIEEMDVDPALAGEMGNHAYLMRADSLEERDRQVQDILKRRF
ncbi:MAG: carbamoylphosphate synthase large subunit [Proteobacteria bacterium]|nr:carbamoylphosphate synthase large subunit [Pseudomonadota bacterium]